MDQPSWIERTLGESWQTTVTGIGGMVVGILCIISAKSFDIPALETLGQAITTIALGALGILARSNAASQKKASELAKGIANTQRHVSEVVQEAKDEAQKVAVDTIRESKP